ncbi:GNAT family N-acetyltransferase [Flavihumibacter petaseus]|uniref:Putative acetyltransferase n=1 Tax=Flavihumibacter petaseus NBRC 106054 TaxID=1220578 RepID=A0A0E9MYD3_9BACT|nr:GNAT family N-acetyltransferase [Flavihumibacter petaseus]GAO42140.1 putative acetyltransferase [Flavihumibacter petaseus NBRC 106054]
MLFEQYFPFSLRLESSRVIMRPLAAEDLEAFWAISQDEDIFTWFTKLLNERDQLVAWIGDALEQRRTHIRFPFTVIDKPTGRVAGSTSLGSISFPDQRIEIGWTWYGNDFRGTGVNTHCKFLLLEYAFETMDFKRVELKTDALNARSRAAIRKLGMTEEGILRSHTAMPRGRRRDSAYYGMLQSEWPEAKAKLLEKL